MRDLNKITITGRLGKDVEVKALANNRQVCNFTVASNRPQKDEAGNWQSHPEWFRIVAFERLAERCAQLLAKGKHVYIEGRVQTREWTDTQGAKHRVTEIVATDMLLLESQRQEEPTENTESEELVGVGTSNPAASKVKWDQMQEDDLPF